MKTLTVTDLHFSYQEKSILAKMDFSLPAGQLIGIVGPNGSGKSTLLKLLARQLTPASGEIRLHQRPLDQYGHKELARTLAYLPQRPHLPAGIRVEQLVRYGRYPHQSWLQQWSEEDNRLVLRPGSRCNWMPSGNSLLPASRVARPSASGSPARISRP